MIKLPKDVLTAVVFRRLVLCAGVLLIAANAAEASEWTLIYKGKLGTTYVKNKFRYTDHDANLQVTIKELDAQNKPEATYTYQIDCDTWKYIITDYKPGGVHSSFQFWREIPMRPDKTWKKNLKKVSSDACRIGRLANFSGPAIYKSYEPVKANGSSPSNYSKPAVSKPVRVKQTSPSRPVAQGSDSAHKMCLQARDYQGCVNSFTGRQSTSSNSDYEREMLRLREEELRQQRIYAQQQQERYERERKDRAWAELQRGLRDLNRPSVNCNTTTFGGNFSTTCF